jgi:hypothetical protein
LQGSAEVKNSLVEFFAGDLDGATQGGRVGGGDDEFEAIVEDEGVEEDGVEVAEVATGLVEGGEVNLLLGRSKGCAFTGEFLEQCEFLTKLDGTILDGAIFFEDFFFRTEDDDSLLSLGIASDIAEVVIQFLDFEKIENLLSFQNAVLLEEEIGKFSVGI